MLEARGGLAKTDCESFKAQNAAPAPATKRGPPTFANARKENYKNTEQNSECSSSLAGAALPVTNYVIHEGLRTCNLQVVRVSRKKRCGAASPRSTLRVAKIVDAKGAACFESLTLQPKLADAVNCATPRTNGVAPAPLP